MTAARALVTGAASGIGRACVRRLLDSGSEVVGFDLDEDGLADLAASCGDRFDPRVVDVADEERAESAISDLGALDLVVNAAGVLLYERLEDTSVDDFRRLLDVNVIGTFVVCRSAAPLLKERRGSIVNLASSAALNGRAYLSAYAASKGAIVGMSRSLAVELAPEVRVNVVCPGAVDTPMTSGVVYPPDHDPMKLARHPSLIGRPSTPEEVAAVVAHLGSPESATTTGLVYRIDGGSAA